METRLTKRRLALIVFAVLLIGVGTLVYVGQLRERSAELYYSGTIEPTESNLAFQVSGRVDHVFLDEGERAANGQLLAELDRSEFLARRNQAEADWVRARETLEKLKAVLEIQRETLPAEVARAEAQVAALEANLDELQSGFRSQEVEQARLTMEKAKATMEKALWDKNRFDELFERSVISQKEREAADLAYETALREYESARESYHLLKEGYRKESIQAAKAKLSEGQAALTEARANLKNIQATEREIEAVKAQVKAAAALLDLAEIQLRYTRLTAPFKGIITSRNVEPGEVVTPGREVISLADLSTVDLKIFVGETQIGKVTPGQAVKVKIDTFPGRTFQGRVSYISPEAEFTPKIIQTHKERVKLVYLVKVSISNPGLELKAGMPADAWLQ
jgi:HlyD family secretion protein